MPVLIYQEVFEAGATSIADQFESAFNDNGWTGSWRWSVYDFHRYHSNALYDYPKNYFAHSGNVPRAEFAT